ncbi:hypothetical protein EIP86_006468 [Pleurotus ostreatoroseus]|nr:hypothetical protein EIP86_006468 [Pleurotus ostreatoroseus]
MALSFLEAGARAVYTIDLPQEPSDGWRTVQKFASTMQMPGEGKAGRLEYICGDVTDQQRMWKLAEEIGDKEKRLDVCVAAAGIGTDSIDCLEYPADVHRKIIEINTTGVLFTAQAAGRQMVRFGHGGSIILIASAAGSIAISSMGTVAYNTSKGAVLQMTRSMACELAPRGVRVNSISPGWIHTPMTDAMIEGDPSYFERITPMARVGRPHELRGAARSSETEHPVFPGIVLNLKLASTREPLSSFSSYHRMSNTESNETPVGVAAALAAASADTQGPSPSPTIFTHDFSLADRVALVSGGNSGIGLEIALGYLEAGARAVYCVDIAQEPSDAWRAAQKYAAALKLPGEREAGRLEYVCGDVTDQDRMWKIAEEIGDKEGRFDVCVAAAGVPTKNIDCLDYPAEEFRRVLDVNTTDVLITAQAAGRQMARFGNGGSIILIASAAGSVAIRGMGTVPYNASKAAVVQLARSMACELAPRQIRVNSLSPGWIYTPMTQPMMDGKRAYFEQATPLARVGRAHELRGVAVWLASASAAFCTGSKGLLRVARRLHRGVNVPTMSKAHRLRRPGLPREGHPTALGAGWGHRIRASFTLFRQSTLRSVNEARAVGPRASRVDENTTVSFVRVPLLTRRSRWGVGPGPRRVVPGAKRHGWTTRGSTVDAGDSRAAVEPEARAHPAARARASLVARSSFTCLPA